MISWIKKILKNRKINLDLSLIISSLSLTISFLTAVGGGIAFYINHIKPFDVYMYTNEPVWYNFKHREDKLTYRDVGIVLRFVIYNTGAQPGLIEDIVVNVESKKELHTYQPLLFVTDSFADLKIDIQAVNNKLLTHRVASTKRFDGYFSSILLKPNEHKIINIFFMPNMDVDRAPLAGNLTMNVRYLLHGDHKYRVYTKKLSKIDSDDWGYSLYLDPDLHKDRKKLLVDVEKNWKSKQVKPL